MLNLAGDVVAEVQQDGAVTAAAFSSDGHFLATASLDGTAAITDLTTGQRLSTYTGHAGAIDAVAFSTTGDLVATGGDDGKVQLWRPNSGDEVATLAGHRAPVRVVAFSPVADRLLSGKRRWDGTGLDVVPERRIVSRGRVDLDPDPSERSSPQWVRLTDDVGHAVRATFPDETGVGTDGEHRRGHRSDRLAARPLTRGCWR